MPEIDVHKPGSFCWIELGTTDQKAAKSFYGRLFGWSADDIPMGPDETYTMFHIDGKAAAAAFRLSAGPRWALYVSVSDADETSKRTASLGGKVVHGPFDVSTFGRMSVLSDPSQAIINVWQPMSHKGMDITGEENTFCWADLSTPDPAKARDFYAGLFGWTMLQDPHDASGYLHIQNGNEFIGGIPPSDMRDEHTPPHWLIYFQSVDCDGAAAKAKELGAVIHMPPMSLPKVGRIAVLADPQGAVFALYEPQNAA